MQGAPSRTPFILMHPPTVHAQFVEDEGSVVFFKNAYGLAATRPFFTDSSDSGIEVEK
jgi:hypothetical protein